MQESTGAAGRSWSGEGRAESASRAAAVAAAPATAAAHSGAPAAKGWEAVGSHALPFSRDSGIVWRLQQSSAWSPPVRARPWVGGLAVASQSFLFIGWLSARQGAPGAGCQVVVDLAFYCMAWVECERGMSSWRWNNATGP